MLNVYFYYFTILCFKESQDISQTIQPIEVLEAEKSSLKFDKKLSSDAISEIWEGYLNEKKVSKVIYVLYIYIYIYMYIFLMLLIRVILLVL